MLSEVLSDLDKISYSNFRMAEMKSTYEAAIPIIENKIKGLEETLTLIAQSREYWRKAIDVAYKRSVGELNEKLNNALKYVFYDDDFSVELTLEDKRGKSLQIIMKDRYGEEIPVKDGCGMGVRSVISFILHAFYLTSKNSHIMFIDEKYSFISDGYLSRFFEFANKLCQESRFTLVIITHDPRLFDYATTKIKVVNGEILNGQ